MIRRSAFDALLVDLDGTLLDGRGRVRPRNAAALQALEAAGVRVMIATGRSTVATLPAVEHLELVTPMLVFNGAGIWCPREERLLEERILATRTVRRALDWGRERGYLMVTQLAREKYALRPRNSEEEQALAFFHGLQFVEPEELPDEYVIRVIYYSPDHESSQDLAREVHEVLGAPAYLTDFPLSLLVTHRASPMNVVDVHPPIRGKAEGVRFLGEHHGITPDRVVAIGDASNDVSMLLEAGLGVAMESACERTRAAADRVIGHHDTDAIAELVGELFGVEV